MATGCKGHGQVGGRGDGVGWPGGVGDTKGTVTAWQGPHGDGGGASRG